MKSHFRFIPLALLLALLALPAAKAWAVTAANTQIINTATLTYNDGTGSKTSSSSVTVTVSLVQSGVNIVSGTNQSTGYNGQATTLTNAFIVTATANGPDTYNLSTLITGSTNTSGATAAVSPASITLGATVTTSGSTTTSLIVPSDGVSNNSVNGIVNGSFIVIDGQTRQVQTVVDNAPGTSQINLASALPTAPAAGLLVAEQKTVNVNVTAGTIITSGTDITVSKNLTVTSATLGTAVTISGPITDTFTSGVAAIKKYVRNTIAASGSGTTFNFGGNTYYDSNVSAKPGDVLEYILVSSNSGAGDVTGASVADALPTISSTLKTGEYPGGTSVTYVSDTNVISYYTSTADSDPATYNAGVLTVNVGTGATNTLGGSIPGGNKSVLVLYQITVTP